MSEELPIGDIQKENSELLDRAIHRVLRDGLKVQVKDAEGNMVIDYIDPPAAFLTAAIKRMQQVGVTKLPLGDDDRRSVMERLQSAAKSASPPPLDLDGDDKATK